MNGAPDLLWLVEEDYGNSNGQGNSGNSGNRKGNGKGNSNGQGEIQGSLHCASLRSR